MNLRKDHSHRATKGCSLLATVLGWFVCGSGRCVSRSLCTVWARRTMQLPEMDASARLTMKNAAKCAMHCELQISAKQQIFQRTPRPCIAGGSIQSAPFQRTLRCSRAPVLCWRVGIRDASWPSGDRGRVLQSGCVWFDVNADCPLNLSISLSGARETY